MIMDIDIENNKKEFNELLKSVNREGTDYLIEDLENLGFYTAPASTRFHLDSDGGLVVHSLNACHAGLRLRKLAIEMKPELEPMLKEDSVKVATLLHDVCKADIYKKVVKRRKDKFGNFTDVKGFDVDFSKFPMGHGEKSAIVVLRSGFEITDEELLAIRWHMTAWDLAFQSPEEKSNINAARDNYPLCALVQLADGMAANLLEFGTNEEEELTW
jgi:hypothetical protein